jgi:hypothetical protein
MGIPLWNAYRSRNRNFNVHKGKDMIVDKRNVAKELEERLEESFSDNPSSMEQQGCASLYIIAKTLLAMLNLMEEEYND